MCDVTVVAGVVGFDVGCVVMHCIMFVVAINIVTVGVCITAVGCVVVVVIVVVADVVLVVGFIVVIFVVGVVVYTCCCLLRC